MVDYVPLRLYAQFCYEAVCLQTICCIKKLMKILLRGSSRRYDSKRLGDSPSPQVSDVNGYWRLILLTVHGSEFINEYRT